MKTVLILTVSSIIALTGCSAGAHVHISSDAVPNDGGAVPAASHNQPQQGTMPASTEVAFNQAAR